MFEKVEGTDFELPCEHRAARDGLRRPAARRAARAARRRARRARQRRPRRAVGDERRRRLRVRRHGPGPEPDRLGDRRGPVVRGGGRRVAHGRRPISRRRSRPTPSRWRRADRPGSPGAMLLPVPIEPPPTRWELPPPEAADEREICGVGADLEPGTLLAAYRTGLFPMRLGLDGPVAWWSPDPRGVIPLDGLYVSRSLRRSQRRFELRINTAFEAVMRGVRRPGAAARLDRRVVRRRVRASCTGSGGRTASRRGTTTSSSAVSTASRSAGFFAGESMFHRATDASKVALLNCVELLDRGRRGAVRRPVGHAAPRVARRGADARDASTCDRLAAAVAPTGPARGPTARLRRLSAPCRSAPKKPACSDACSRRSARRPTRTR